MNKQTITLLLQVFAFIAVIIIIVFSVKRMKKESYAYPFPTVENALKRRMGESPCVSGCVIQTRRGVYIDRVCQDMCRNWYTDKLIKGTNYGYQYSQTSLYNNDEKYKYLRDLKQEVKGGKSSTQFSTISK